MKQKVVIKREELEKILDIYWVKLGGTTLPDQITVEAEVSEKECDHVYEQVYGIGTLLGQGTCRKCGENEKPKTLKLAPALWSRNNHWYLSTELFCSEGEALCEYAEKGTKVIWPAIPDPKTGFYIVEENEK